MSLSIKTLLKQLVVVIILSAFAIAAGNAEEHRKSVDDLGLRGSDCILIRTIRDYTPLDDSNLLIWGPAKRGYLVTLIRPGFGIRSSFRLGFSSRDDQLCPYGGDSIVFDGFDSEKISVRSISRVSAEQIDEILIRFGKKTPTEQQTPAPADAKGAEVEELD